MAKAKTISEKDLKQVLTYIAQCKHAPRNRAMLLLTHFTGMRVGEVAALLTGDVVSLDGKIKCEIQLSPAQTKGHSARTVFIGDRMRKELAAYVKSLKLVEMEKPLFPTQKKDRFSANTLCQHFHYLYKNSGVDGASSHSGRRSFITNLANKGVGVRVLMALAGHKNIATTQIYIDCNDDMQRAAVDLI